MTMDTSMASHQASMVAQSRSVSGMFTANTNALSRIFCSSTSAGELLASSRRSCSLTPQAAPISSVGSSARRVAFSRASAAADRVLPARSSSRHVDFAIVLSQRSSPLTWCIEGDCTA
nr:hypothetical protein [Geodermatophilus sp. TF02-6]